VTGRNSYYLLFSDGFVNINASESYDNLRAPIYIISTSELTNVNLLKIWGTFSMNYEVLVSLLARKSGGAYFKVTQQSEISNIIPKVRLHFYFLNSIFRLGKIRLVMFGPLMTRK
jgi:hypothetical protein